VHLKTPTPFKEEFIPTLIHSRTTSRRVVETAAHPRVSVNDVPDDVMEALARGVELTVLGQTGGEGAAKFEALTALDRVRRARRDTPHDADTAMRKALVLIGKGELQARGLGYIITPESRCDLAMDDVSFLCEWGRHYVASTFHNVAHPFFKLRDVEVDALMAECGGRMLKKPGMGESIIAEAKQRLTRSSDYRVDASDVSIKSEDQLIDFIEADIRQRQREGNQKHPTFSPNA
jgi:hypothetical protein